MTSHSNEILIRCQQGHIIGDAQLGKYGVDRPYLESCAAAIVPQLGSVDMILALGKHARQRRKALDDVASGLRPCKPLQQFLQYQPGCRDGSALFERGAQRANLGSENRLVSPQEERPHARIDKQNQRRERSAL